MVSDDTVVHLCVPSAHGKANGVRTPLTPQCRERALCAVGLSAFAKDMHGGLEREAHMKRSAHASLNPPEENVRITRLLRISHEL